MSFVRVLFFIAPGLVPLSQISGTAHDLLLLNPMTGLFESVSGRAALRPGAGRLRAALPAAIGVVLLVVFIPVFRSEQRQFAKILEF